MTDAIDVPAIIRNNNTMYSAEIISLYLVFIYLFLSRDINVEDIRKYFKRMLKLLYLVSYISNGYIAIVLIFEPNSVSFLNVVDEETNAITILTK